MGEKLVTFETNDKIVNYSSDLGFNGTRNPFPYSEENIYFMLQQKQIPIQEYEASTEKNEYHCFYEKDDEIKGDNITDENEGIIENGNDFKNCKSYSRQTFNKNV